ncbi:centrosomal AT-AC splicing factor-like [Lytechinus pictus]|uniref:centrosomal AT-AC splicing factor-like n=1 Tax=Lytechinus pictus TaxID=7653 RepID=UPI0030BA0683
MHGIVKAAEALIGCPEVIEGSYEKGSTYWCIFCSCDVPRHAQDGLVTLKLAMFIEHLCSASHKQASIKYYRTHNGDPEKIKQRLVFSDEDYSRFKTNLTEALDQFENKAHADLQESAAKIRRLEKEHLQHTQDTPPQPDHPQSKSPQGRSSDWNSDMQARTSDQQQQQNLRGVQILGRVRTKGVISSGGLTSISTNTKQASTEGNIHTGAPPPWLTADSHDAGTSSVIGPVEDDFIKHLKREKKKKLNPNRVGANFDHLTPTNEEWLPSFGRVWNSGRRWQSRHQYRKEKKDEGRQRRKAPHTESKPP